MKTVNCFPIKIVEIVHEIGNHLIIMPPLGSKKGFYSFNTSSSHYALIEGKIEQNDLKFENVIIKIETKKLFTLWKRVNKKREKDFDIFITKLVSNNIVIPVFYDSIPYRSFVEPNYLFLQQLI